MLIFDRDGNLREKYPAYKAGDTAPTYGLSHEMGKHIEENHLSAIGAPTHQYINHMGQSYKMTFRTSYIQYII